MILEIHLESPSHILADTLSVDGKSPLHYRQTPIPDGSHLMNLKIGKTEESIRAVVFAEVASVSAVDLHTHLLPPSHGALCLWGIDELLTYVRCLFQIVICFMSLVTLYHSLNTNKPAFFLLGLFICFRLIYSIIL